MKNNVIQNKTYNFSLKIIKFYQYLVQEKKEFILSKQILRSGTSIGANVEEALGGYSEKDFLSKITIAYKEARETNYWLRLLKNSLIIDENLANSIIDDCFEILRISSSIKRTLKAKLA